MTGVSVVDTSAVTAAMATARRIDFSAYTLRPASDVVVALEAAADRGCAVAVTVEARPYGGAATGGDLSSANAALAAELEAHGARVRLVAPDEVPVHMKAAVVDDAVFLDDRNWPSDGGDTIVSTRDGGVRAAVLDALGGHGNLHERSDFATDKRAALRLEARAIDAAIGDSVDVETESFGPSAVSAALRRRAAAGDHVRLIVAAREYAANADRVEGAMLRRLAAAGVEVRISPNDEKLALVGAGAGAAAWVGSANATFTPSPQIDWGLVTRDRTTVASLGATFERNWRAAEPLPRASN